MCALQKAKSDAEVRGTPFLGGCEGALQKAKSDAKVQGIPLLGGRVVFWNRALA